MLEQYISMYCSYQQDNWDHLLPLVEFSLNHILNTSAGVLPFVDKGYHPATTICLECNVADVCTKDYTIDPNHSINTSGNRLCLSASITRRLQIRSDLQIGSWRLQIRSLSLRSTFGPLILWSSLWRTTLGPERSLQSSPWLSTPSGYLRPWKVFIRFSTFPNLSPTSWICSCLRKNLLWLQLRSLTVRSITKSSRSLTLSSMGGTRCPENNPGTILNGLDLKIPTNNMTGSLRKTSTPQTTLRASIDASPMNWVHSPSCSPLLLTSVISNKLQSDSSLPYFSQFTHLLIKNVFESLLYLFSRKILITWFFGHFHWPTTPPRWFCLSSPSLDPPHSPLVLSPFPPLDPFLHRCHQWQIEP